jgi:hypothetical protein
MTDDWSHKGTEDRLPADDTNFYKVEKWSTDGERVEMLLFAGSDFNKARSIFANFVNRRPQARLTIRRGNRVVTQWFP